MILVTIYVVDMTFSGFEWAYYDTSRREESGDEILQVQITVTRGICIMDHWHVAMERLYKRVVLL